MKKKFEDHEDLQNFILSSVALALRLWAWNQVKDKVGQLTFANNLRT